MLVQPGEYILLHGFVKSVGALIMGKFELFGTSCLPIDLVQQMLGLSYFRLGE